MVQSVPMEMRGWSPSAAGVLGLALLMLGCGSSAATGNDGGGPGSPGELRWFPLEMLSSPTTITVGPDGNVWFVVSSQVYDAATNTVLIVTKLGKITPSGQVAEYDFPDTSAAIYGLTGGPDGNVWFTERFANRIGFITPDGSVTQYSIPMPGYPQGIVTGPDGNLWFISQSGRIGTCTPAGQISERSLGATANPGNLALGPDGNFWFTQGYSNAVGRVTPAGMVTTFPLDVPAIDIAAGGDGNLWITQDLARTIGRLTPGGGYSAFDSPLSGPPGAIAKGPDGNIWYFHSGALMRMKPDGSTTLFSLSMGDTFGAPSPQPVDLVTGSDGAIWFSAVNPPHIGRFVPP